MNTTIDDKVELVRSVKLGRRPRTLRVNGKTGAVIARLGKDMAQAFGVSRAEGERAVLAEAVRLWIDHVGAPYRL